MHKNRVKKIYSWCSGGEKKVCIVTVKKNNKFCLKKHVRCLICGQRFRPVNVPCERQYGDDYETGLKYSCCVSQYVPKHKAY